MKETVYNYPFDKIFEYKQYESVIVSNSRSNCKLDYLDSVSNLCTTTNKKYFDEILKKCRGLVYLTVNGKEEANFILKNYETYFHEEIPAGYGDDPQHHILIKNISTTITSKYLLREKEQVKPNNALALNKTKIKANFTKLLKSKRRKTDIVNELMDCVLR